MIGPRLQFTIIDGSGPESIGVDIGVTGWKVAASMPYIMSGYHLYWDYNTIPIVAGLILPVKDIIGIQIEAGYSSELIDLTGQGKDQTHCFRFSIGAFAMLGKNAISFMQNL